MWHVSIRNNGKLDSLRHLAKKELQGVGDASKGEWEELSPTAYHLRRRLSDKEDQKIGPAIDIRGSVEEIERLKRVRSFLFSS